MSTLLINLTPSAVSKEKFIGEATFYHNYFQGRKMANGKRFNQNRYTGANNYYRLGTKLKITNLKNNKSVIITVTDRGNFSHRNVDLSTRAFREISRLNKGRIRVKIEKIN